MLTNTGGSAENRKTTPTADENERSDAADDSTVMKPSAVRDPRQ